MRSYEITRRILRQKHNKTVKRELIEWLIAVALFCSIFGKFIGSQLITLGCLIEQILTPLCKRLWYMIQQISIKVYWR